MVLGEMENNTTFFLKRKKIEKFGNTSAMACVLSVDGFLSYLLATDLIFNLFCGTYFSIISDAVFNQTSDFSWDQKIEGFTLLHSLYFSHFVFLYYRLDTSGVLSIISDAVFDQTSDFYFKWWRDWLSSIFFFLYFRTII